MCDDRSEGHHAIERNKKKKKTILHTSHVTPLFLFLFAMLLRLLDVLRIEKKIKDRNKDVNLDMVRQKQVSMMRLITENILRNKN